MFFTLTRVSVKMFVSKKLMNVLVGVITTKLFPLREIGTNVFPLFTFSEVFRY